MNWAHVKRMGIILKREHRWNGISGGAYSADAALSGDNARAVRYIKTSAVS